MKRRSSQGQDLHKILKDMDSVDSEYPAEMLSARRSAFLDQVARHGSMEVEEQVSPEDQKIIDLLLGLRAFTEEYPPQRLAARRAAFMRQIDWIHWKTLWASLRSAIRRRIAFPAGTLPASKTVRTSLIAVSLALAAVAGIVFYGNKDPLPAFVPSQPGTIHSGRIVTGDTRAVRIMCKPGYLPPLCLAGEFVRNQNLTFQGNGTARPAVAKDTASGNGSIYRPSNVNDGLYGPGASWISKSEDSWVKIDLGKATKINTIAFGRDRLGKFNDRNPGQFVIAVALADDVYADGNNHNDNLEYVEVYNSEQAGFSGTLSSAETVMAQFEPREVRFIKITFEKEGTAIDEVEAFFVPPPVAAGTPRGTPVGQQPDDTSTPYPTKTLYPSDTPTAVPTFTPLPTDTATALPTNTPIPTDTPLPPNTNTPIPTNTAARPPTSTPPPTDTAIPPPTGTALSTSTAIPQPTGAP